LPKARESNWRIIRDQTPLAPLRASPVGLKSHQKFAGALIQGWKAYNITPEPKWGIGAWSDAQLQGYLAHGHADGRSSAGGIRAVGG